MELRQGLSDPAAAPIRTPQANLRCSVGERFETPWSVGVQEWELARDLSKPFMVQVRSKSMPAAEQDFWACRS